MKRSRVYLIGSLLLLFVTGCNGSPSSTLPIISSMNQPDTLLQARMLISEGKSQACLDLLGASGNWKNCEQAILAGQAHQELNQPGEALSAYEQAATLDPNSHLPQLRMGVLAYNQGDLEKARHYLARYLKDEQGNPEAWYYLYLTDPDSPEAVKALRMVSALDGNDAYWSRSLLEVMEK